MRNGYVTYKLDGNSENLLDKASTAGMTALHFSALNRSMEMTDFLCLHDANPHSQSEMGDTPLHLAIRRRILGSGYDDYWRTGDYSIEEHRSFITDWKNEEAIKILNQINTIRVRIIDILLRSGSINVNIANNKEDYPHYIILFNK